MENLRAVYIKQEFVEISEGTKVLIDVDLKLTGLIKIPKVLDKSKLIKNYSDLLNDLTILCEKLIRFYFFIFRNAVYFTFEIF